MADDDSQVRRRPEFAAVWFDSIQAWRVVFDDGRKLAGDGKFASQGAAIGTALDALGAGEDEYCIDNLGPVATCVPETSDGGR